MKIVIAGAGDVGVHLTRMLAGENHEITLIDSREQRLKEIAADVDIRSFTGLASSVDTLMRAGAGLADLFISVTSNEQANVMSAIISKSLGARKCLARIDNLEYLDEDKRALFYELGIDYMFYPELLTANEITNQIQESASTDSMSFANGKLQLYVMRMEEHAPAINQTIEEFHNLTRDPEYKVVGIVRNNTTFIPTNNERFQEDDLALIITTPKGIEIIVRNFGKKNNDIRSVMILGGSRVGINTARQLSLKQTVKVIEKDRTKSYELANMLRGALVINGDGRNFELLKDEGIGHIDAFIAVTGDPEINLITCLLAKQLGVKKTIAAIENSDYIKLAENMDIDNVINKKSVTASKIFSFTLNDEVSSVKCLTCSEAEVVEYMAKPDSKVTQVPLKEIKLPEGAVIGGVVRGKEAIIADEDVHIKPFDKVIVLAMPDTLHKVGKFFNPQDRFF
jgi:trk system potassium uptake protein TrkA